jgi:hypothetical protein
LCAITFASYVNFDDSFCRSCNFDKYISIEVVTSMAKFVEAITSMIYFVEVVTSMTYLVEVITSMINLVEAVTSMVKVVEVITSTKILSKLNFDKNTNFDTTYIQDKNTTVIRKTALI